MVELVKDTEDEILMHGWYIKTKLTHDQRDEIVKALHLRGRGHSYKSLASLTDFELYKQYCTEYGYLPKSCAVLPIK